MTGAELTQRVREAGDPLAVLDLLTREAHRAAGPLDHATYPADWAASFGALASLSAWVISDLLRDSEVPADVLSPSGSARASGAGVTAPAPDEPCGCVGPVCPVGGAPAPNCKFGAQYHRIDPALLDWAESDSSAILEERAAQASRFKPGFDA